MQLSFPSRLHDCNTVRQRFCIGAVMTAVRATVEYLISRMLRLSSWLLLFAVPLRSPATKSQNLNRRFMFHPRELRYRRTVWSFLVLTFLVSNYESVHGAAPLTKVLVTTGSASEREGAMYVAQ